MSVGEHSRLHEDFKKDKKKKGTGGRDGIRSEPAEMGVPFYDHSPSFSRSNKNVHPCSLICGCFFFLFFKC